MQTDYPTIPFNDTTRSRAGQLGVELCRLGAALARAAAEGEDPRAVAAQARRAVTLAVTALALADAHGGDRAAGRRDPHPRPAPQLLAQLPRDPHRAQRRPRRPGRP